MFNFLNSVLLCKPFFTCWEKTLKLWKSFPHENFFYARLKLLSSRIYGIPLYISTLYGILDPVWHSEPMWNCKMFEESFILYSFFVWIFFYSLHRTLTQTSDINLAKFSEMKFSLKWVSFRSLHLNTSNKVTIDRNESSNRTTLIPSLTKNVM